MIPIKLALRNFMCYHDNVPALYFDSFHVACLCGNNGNGKSALLDAITWALWGKARAKSDDDLIHLGEGEMEVEFEFAVGESRYRVLRKRRKGGLRRTGHSLLELQVGSPEDYVPITGNTIAETQRKIVEILRMDFDTFINSAMLLQGRADEFSTKRPGERKEVLGNILGLSLYDDLEKLARDHSKEKELQQRSLSEDIARIEHQLELRESLEAQQQQTEAALSAISSQAEEQELTLSKLSQSRESLKFRREQYEELGRQVEQAGQQLQYLETRAGEHRSKIERYEGVLSSYEQEFATLRARLGELLTNEQELKQSRERAEGLSNRIHYFQSVNAQLKKEMEDLKGKVDLLAQGEAECPLCGTELGVEGRERIVANYAAQGREKGDAYRANLDEMKQKEAELGAAKQEASSMESAITRERSQCERRTELLEKERAEAEASLPKERESLAHAEKTVESLRTAHEENSEKRKAILAEIQSSPDIEGQFGVAEKRLREFRDQERKLRDTLIETQTSLRRCQQLEIERKEKAKAQRRASEEKSIFDELAVAFGKRGVQALIIESALPEIEEEANRLLGRMTDNRMHLKVESQRGTRKGDTIETLDIKISDELGTRNYEMFSGGEAFRVDFALRMALSKLLARRAGAPLSTLFIDEGFGTQDTAGREKLVEAINSIQDDFEKILVITHIEELKDAFPVRIDVTKTEEGSTFSLD